MDRPFSIVCPHCNAEQDLASAEVSYGDGDVSELKCDNCGKPFFCECTVMCFVNYPHPKGMASCGRLFYVNRVLDNMESYISQLESKVASLERMLAKKIAQPIDNN